MTNSVISAEKIASLFRGMCRGIWSVEINEGRAFLIDINGDLVASVEILDDDSNAEVARMLLDTYFNPNFVF